MTIDDLIAGHPEAVAELEQLRSRVGYLQDRIGGDGSVSDDNWREGRQKLFDLLQQEFDVTAVDSQLADIEQCVMAYCTHHQAESDPVAWMDQDGCLHTTSESAHFSGRPVAPLYLGPQPAAQVPEGWKETIGEAVNLATVLDDGGDGADGESARRIVSLLKGLLSAAPSIAEKREEECNGNRTRTVQVGEKLFEFSSEQDWVNKGPNIWRRHRVRSEDVLVLDQLGRTCRIGKHFRDAEEDGAYPVEVFRHRPEPPEVQS